MRRTVRCPDIIARNGASRQTLAEAMGPAATGRPQGTSTREERGAATSALTRRLLPFVPLVHQRGDRALLLSRTLSQSAADRIHVGQGSVPLESQESEVGAQP